MSPDPTEVARVMSDTGMDKMQAYYAVQGRDVLCERGLRGFDRDVRHAQREDTRPIDAIAPTLVRYWRDPVFAAQLDAETEQRRAEAHAARQAVIRAENEARWAREEEENQ